MADENLNKEELQNNVLTPEQSEILDLYLKKLDNFIENIKESEEIQAKIEALHLKKILTK
jgi:hypothetical protein